jgi:hypothetical protein
MDCFASLAMTTQGSVVWDDAAGVNHRDPSA